MIELQDLVLFLITLLALIVLIYAVTRLFIKSKLQGQKLAWRAKLAIKRKEKTEEFKRWKRHRKRESENTVSGDKRSLLILEIQLEQLRFTSKLEYMSKCLLQIDEYTKSEQFSDLQSEELNKLIERYL